MYFQLLANGIIAGSTYALVALGFAVIYRTARFFHFAHGAVYAVAAYAGYSFATDFGLGKPVGLTFGAVIGALLGVLLQVAVYAPIRRRGGTELTLLLASLGLYVILQNAISLTWGDDVRTLRASEVVPGHQLWGAYFTNVQLIIATTSFAAMTTLWLVLWKTRFGKAMRATPSNVELARISGIRADRYLIYAFAIGSLLAGIAGGLISLDRGLSPTMGLNALLPAVVAVVIGGAGSFVGAALGGLCLGFAETIGIWLFSSRWFDAVIYAVAIGFLLVRPHGLWGGEPPRAQA